MQGWGHSGGFSVHGGVRVAAQDRAGRERLLRYCARPMFAGGRLVWAGGGAQVRYRLPLAALQRHRREQQQQRSIELRLSASEFLDRVAALIPPPRKHRHRYFGVLAPNSLWRALVVAQVAGSRGRGARHPSQRQFAQILAPRGRDTRRDICGHSCWRVSTGCLRSSAAGAAGGCAWLGSSQSRRRCGRYLNMLVSQQVHRKSPRRVDRQWR